MKFVTYRLEKIVNIQEKIMYILFNLLYNRISILSWSLQKSRMKCIYDK